MIMPSVYETSSEEEESIFPASFAQQRLWFLDQLEPNTTTSNLSLSVHVGIPLEREAIEQSLHALVQRHAVLRTTFRVKDAQLMQVISPTFNVHLLVVDVQSLPASQREVQLQQIHIEAQLPFDLARGPLWRTTLLQLDEQEAVLLLTGHQLTFDGWSMGLFFQEWITLYEALCHNQPSTLLNLPIQYADFARWQLTELTDERLTDHLSYWKQQLNGAPSILELPADHSHPQGPTYRDPVYPFVLPQQVKDALEALIRQEGVSLFALLVAAFKTLLYRYTGQDDLLVGTLISERTLLQFQGLLGNFLNPLILRTNLSGNPTFRELIGRVQEVNREAYTHQDVPFEHLVKKLQPERTLGHHPFSQVLLTVHPSLPILPSGWAFSQVYVETSAIPFDLSLELDEEGFTGRLRYNLDLFDPATIVRMVEHWQTLLAGIATDPDQHIADLPLLTKAEWQEQVVEWNATQRDYPQDKCYHELFEAQVEQTPEAVAVVCGQQQLTYQELNQRANHLAHHLQDLGVMPETLVALLLERSIDFVVAILAVFKAGGAFLPLDPQHPTRRHFQVLQQSRSSLVLTTDTYGPELAEALREIDSNQRPQVKHIEVLFQQRSAEENLSPQSGPGNLAYVMYTSGSTGIPKGVMVEQVGMVNHIYAKITDLSIRMEDRVAQNGPPCFDIVVWQCLAALLVGGSVYIFQDDIAHDPMRLLQQIEKQNITILQAVPSILRAVAQQAVALGEERPRLSALRWVVPTGDALTPELCRQWLQLYPTIPLLNTYGSTECSDDQCHYAIYQPPAFDYPLPIMPIGRPIQNMLAYVLDQRLMPVPIGVVGDLYIGGIGVGRGYLHDAERTDEVFLPDPFSHEPGARLYKARDRARYLSDGSIEFLGRTDHLVKINGVRIEPGEIEAVLERHPVVREAVVIAREAAGGNKYLAAYIVPIDVQRPTIEELRTWIREKLPEYMAPAAFLFLDAIPLNSNGKLDRRALPMPDYNHLEQEDDFVAPRSPLEKEVASIWSQALSIQSVGLHDNFFALGGHSLLAMQVMTRLQATLHVDVPLRSFFEAPTLAQLTEAITHLQVQGAGTRKPGLRPLSRKAYRVPVPSTLSTQENANS